MSQRGAMKVLLLDEDYRFAKSLNGRLQIQGINLHWHKSLFELGSVGKLGNYDLIIVDPLIEPVNGLEVAEYVDTFFPGLPVILIGRQDHRFELSHWPKSVVGCSYKTELDKMVTEIKKHSVSPEKIFHFSKPTQQRNCVSA